MSMSDSAVLRNEIWFSTWKEERIGRSSAQGVFNQSGARRDETMMSVSR